MSIKEDLVFFMKNRIDTILQTNGVINRYESTHVPILEVKNYLFELGYSPKSASTLENSQYYVYLIKGKKYILQEKDNTVRFYQRGY